MELCKPKPFVVLPLFRRNGNEPAKAGKVSSGGFETRRRRERRGGSWKRRLGFESCVISTTTSSARYRVFASFDSSAQMHLLTLPHHPCLP